MIPKLHTVLLIFALSVAAPFATAQTSGPSKGKTVAIYFSKKHFEFNEDWRFPLGEFIRSEMGMEAPLDDLKRQALVALGTALAQQLKPIIGADSVFFLNTNPELGAAFIKSYDADAHTFDASTFTKKGADIVFVFNPFYMGSWSRNIVYVRSNKWITEKEIILTTRVKLEAFDTESGNRIAAVETCFDEKADRVTDPDFDFHNDKSRTGKLYASMFTHVFRNLNQRKETNCEPEGQ